MPEGADPPVEAADLKEMVFALSARIDEMERANMVRGVRDNRIDRRLGHADDRQARHTRDVMSHTYRDYVSPRQMEEMDELRDDHVVDVCTMTVNGVAEAETPGPGVIPFNYVQEQSNANVILGNVQGNRITAVMGGRYLVTMSVMLKMPRYVSSNEEGSSYSSMGGCSIASSVNSHNETAMASLGDQFILSTGATILSGGFLKGTLTLFWPVRLEAGESIWGTYSYNTIFVSPGVAASSTFLTLMRLSP